MNPWKCVPIYLHVDGENAQVGLWCDECQLPSVVRFPILSMSESGIAPAGVVDRCMECEDFGEDEGEDGDCDRLVRD